LLGRRVYLHVHPSHFWDFYRKGGGVRRSMVAFAFRLSAKVVFLTEDMKLKFSTLIPPGRCAVLPNPVRTGSFLFHTRPPMAGNCTLLFLGWIIPQKGVYDIVEVIPRVAERFPEVMFLFAGNKEVAKLTALLEERSLTRNARVLGWVAGEEKLNLLSASRLLLLPTYSEGIPNVILEAMASGLPAVTTAVGGIPSVFTEGENGYYVVPGDTNQLASTVIRLLQDDAECERLSRLTRQKVQRFYDSEVIGEQMETIYEA